MKKLSLILILLLAPASWADKEDSVAALKARAEHSHPKEQVELFTEIAQHQLDALDKAYSGGTVQEAQSALADIVEYGVKAADLSGQTGKKMKHTEIALRKMTGRLENIRRTLDVDDRPPVAEAIQKLETARTQLLNRMFSK